MGKHGGEEISNSIIAILGEFKIQNKLGYFIMDNASSNDTCLDILALKYGLNKAYRGIRCVDHIINFFARQLLYGVNPDAFEEENQEIHDQEAQFQLWRKLRPIRRLHNICKWVVTRTQRCERLHSLQKEEYIVINEGNWLFIDAASFITHKATAISALTQRTFDLKLANEMRRNSNVDKIGTCFQASQRY